MLQIVHTCFACEKILGPRHIEVAHNDYLLMQIDVRICGACRQNWAEEKAATVRAHIEQSLAVAALPKIPEPVSGVGPKSIAEDLLKTLKEESQKYWAGATMRNGGAGVDPTNAEFMKLLSEQKVIFSGSVEGQPWPTNCTACGAAYRPMQAMGKPVGVIGQMLCDCEYVCDMSQPGVLRWYTVAPAKETAPPMKAPVP